MHGGVVDPQAIGRKGGSRSPLTKLRKAAGQDDGLREQAREVLSRALRCEKVDKAQLDAARSLFAFRPAAAPPSGPQGGLPHDGKNITLDLLHVAAECNALSAGGYMDADAERDLAARLEARRPRVDAADRRATIPPPVSENERETVSGYPPPAASNCGPVDAHPPAHGLGQASARHTYRGD